MIPYDDLVAALAGWRQRQGLPVSPAAAAAAAARTAAAAAPRSAPPGPPPAAPVAQIVHEHEVEETQYDPEGDDFAIPLGEPGEATSTGGAPKRNDW